MDWSRDRKHFVMHYVLEKWSFQSPRTSHPGPCRVRGWAQGLAGLGYMPIYVKLGFPPHKSQFFNYHLRQLALMLFSWFSTNVIFYVVFIIGCTNVISTYVVSAKVAISQMANFLTKRYSANHDSSILIGHKRWLWYKINQLFVIHNSYIF